MDDVALANYVTGSYFGYVEAGRIDSICAKLLGVPPRVEIWFSDYTLMKLHQRHGDINFSHYHHMPSILLSGSIARGRTQNVLTFCWVGPVSGETIAFLVALKATKKREVFVATFHRVHLREARRFLKGGKRDGRLIREQSDAEQYLKPGTDHLKPKK